LTPSLPAGRYTILGLLPLVQDEPRYRVSSNDDGRARVVSEEEIRLPATRSRSLSQSEPPLVTQKRQIEDLRGAVAALMEPDMPRILRAPGGIMVLDKKHSR
jgi:hypothetical protein